MTPPGLWLSAALALLACGGCTSAPARVALRGDLSQLKSEVQRAGRAGEVGEARAREVARAVLARELVSLQLHADEFPDVASCSAPMRGALEDVAEGGGEFAGSAAVALIDAGFDAPRGSLDSATAREIIRARKALGPHFGVRRREYMLHGDAEVRRAAFRAAAAEPDPADIRALLEAARLDPDAPARALAIDALSRIGGERVVLGLVDVWARAPAELRFELLEAWAAPPCLGAGGESQLVHRAEHGEPELAVAAAVLLERHGVGPAGLGTRVLSSALAGRDVAARRLALRDAPWENAELRAAITEAARSGAMETRLLAWLRIAENGALDPVASAELGRIASAPPEQPAPAVTLARAVLARAGDARARPGLRADLAAPRAEQRLLAALSLAWLDDWGGAAEGLADDSPDVRRDLACQLLAGPAERADRSSSSRVAPRLLGLLDDIGEGPAAAPASPPSPQARPRTPPRKP